MQPNNQVPPAYTGGGQASPPGQNQYDFIFNNQPAGKRPMLSGGGSQNQRLVIVIGGVVGLLTVFLIILFLILQSGGDETQALVKIAQQQNQVITMSATAELKARSGTTVNIAKVTELSTTSSQQELIAYLAKKHRKVTPKDLLAGADTTVTKSLTAAAQSGQFDEVFTPLLKQEVTELQSAVRQRFLAASVKEEKDLLNKLYEQLALILKNLG